MSNEILISTSKDVLQEILNPETHTVSWDFSSAEELQEALTIAQQVNTMRIEHIPNMKMTVPFNKAASLGLTPLYKQIHSHQPFFQEIARQLNFSGDINTSLALFPPNMSAPRGLPNAVPHLDKESLGMFISFNKKADGTMCIPSAHINGNKNTDDFFENADKSKAIALPGASLSIIDLGKQVHYQPEISKTHWRVLGRCIA